MLRNGVVLQADTVYLKPEELERLCLDYGEAGAQRIMLQDFMPRDGAMIELAAAELLSRG